MEVTDHELLSQYRRGHVAALETLVERHRRTVFGFILNMTNDYGDAEEVFQEVWFRVIRKIGMYRERNFPGWLVRIARNIIIDRARRRKPDFSLDSESRDGRSPGDVLPGKDPGPRARLAASDLGRKIVAAVAVLPREQKEVFLMRLRAEIPFKEIARIQKVSINTALARMQYALDKLRTLLKDDYEGLASGRL